MKRRDFIAKSAQAGAALSTLGIYACNATKGKKVMGKFPNNKELFFRISLAQWSFNRALFGGTLNHLDFAAKSRSLECEGLEYVNGFFFDKAQDIPFLNEMNTRAKGEGQENVLIMIDREGNLADANTKERLKAIENHFKWVDAAHHLGCHSIRVNLGGGKNKEDAVKAAIDSMTKLSDFSKDSGINILVENHGGFSSDGKWMSDVFSQLKNENCGTLPDFGNFCINYGEEGCIEEYDRYIGMKELLPFAKAVSAKSHDFDAQGNEIHTDFLKVMRMVKDVGYKGFVGIEFEGSGVSEEQGVILTRDLLRKIGKQI